MARAFVSLFALLSLTVLLSAVGLVAHAEDLAATNPSLPLPTPALNPYCASSDNGDNWFAMVTVTSTNRVTVVAGNRQYYCNGTYNYPSMSLTGSLSCGGYASFTQPTSSTFSIVSLTFNMNALSFDLVVRTRGTTQVNPDDVTLTGLTAARCSIAPIGSNPSSSGGAPPAAAGPFCGTVGQGDYFAQLTTTFPFGLSLQFSAPFNAEATCYLTGTYLIIDNTIVPLLSSSNFNSPSCYAWSVVSLQWDTTTLQPSTVSITATVSNQLRSFTLSTGSCGQLPEGSYCGSDPNYRVAVISYLSYFTFYAAETGTVQSQCTVMGAITGVVNGEPVLQLNSINGCVGLALQSLNYAGGVLTVQMVVGSVQRSLALNSASCDAIPTSLSLCGVSNSGLMAAVNFASDDGLIMQIAGFGVPTWNACGISMSIAAVVNGQLILDSSSGNADSCDMNQAPGLVGSSMTYNSAAGTFTIVFSNDTSTETIVATAAGCSSFAPYGASCGYFGGNNVIAAGFVSATAVRGSLFPQLWMYSNVDGSPDLQAQCSLSTSGTAPFATVMGTTVLGRLTTSCPLFTMGPMVYANGILSISTFYNATQYQFGLTPQNCGQWSSSYCGTTSNYSSFVTVANSSSTGALTVSAGMAPSQSTGMRSCIITASGAAIVSGRLLATSLSYSCTEHQPKQILFNGVLMSIVGTQGSQFVAATAGTCLPLSYQTFCSAGSNFYGYATTTWGSLLLYGTRTKANVFQLSSYSASSVTVVDDLLTSIVNSYNNVITNITTTNSNQTLTVTVLNQSGPGALTQSFSSSLCVSPQSMTPYCGVGGVSTVYFATARFNAVMNSWTIAFASVSNPTSICEVTYNNVAFADNAGMYSRGMSTNNVCSFTPTWVSYSMMLDQLTVTVNNQTIVLSTIQCTPLPNNASYCGTNTIAASIFFPNRTGLSSFRATAVATAGLNGRVQAQAQAYYYPVAIGTQGYILLDYSQLSLSQPITYNAQNGGSISLSITSGSITLRTGSCNTLANGIYCGSLMNAGTVAARFALVVDSPALAYPSLTVSTVAPFAVSACLLQLQTPWIIIDNVFYTSSSLSCTYDISLTLAGSSVNVAWGNGLTGNLATSGCTVPTSTQYCGRWKIPGGSTGAALQLLSDPLTNLQYRYGVVFLLPTAGQCQAAGNIFFFTPEQGSTIAPVLMTGTGQCLQGLSTFKALNYNTQVNDIEITLVANTVQFPTGSLTPASCGVAPSGTFCASNAYLNTILTVTPQPGSFLSIFQLNATATGTIQNLVCTYTTLVVVVDNYLVLTQPFSNGAFCNSQLQMQMIGLGVNPNNGATAAQLYVLYMRVYQTSSTSSVNLLLAQDKCTTMPSGLYCGILSSCCTRRSVVLQVINGQYAGQQYATVSVSAENALQLYPQYVRGLSVRGFAQGQALLDNSSVDMGLTILSLSYASSAGVLTISGTVNNVKFFSTMDQTTSCGNIGSLAGTFQPAAMAFTAGAGAGNQLTMNFGTLALSCSITSPYMANPSSGNVMVASPVSSCGSNIVPYFLEWNATSQTLATAVLLYGRYPLSYNPLLVPTNPSSGNAANFGNGGGALSSAQASDLSSSHIAAVVAAIAAVVAAIGVAIVLLKMRSLSAGGASSSSQESRPFAGGNVGPSKSSYSAPASELETPMNPTDSQA